MYLALRKHFLLGNTRALLTISECKKDRGNLYVWVGGVCVCVCVCVRGSVGKMGNGRICLLGVGHPALGHWHGSREERRFADQGVPSHPVSPECLRQEEHHLWSQLGLVSHTSLSAWAQYRAFLSLSLLICKMGCLSPFRTAVTKCHRLG